MELRKKIRAKDAGDHRADAGELDCGGGLLAARAAAEVLAGQDDVARLEARADLGVSELEQVLRRSSRGP